MEGIKGYELSQKEYVPVICEGQISYGGSQQWFSDRLPKSREARLHHFGCGIIAASDLFMYWAMTMPYRKQSSALRSLEKDGTLLKENYMSFVEYIRDKYIYIPPKVGVPNVELVVAINRYMWSHQIDYKAQLGYLTDHRKMLKKIIEMIKNDLPVILLLGTPFPGILYQLLAKNKNIGIPFYELKSDAKGGKFYQQSIASVQAHYVTITGVFINKAASNKREKVMLKISSWGKEYYISYYEYCKYEIKYGVDLQGSIIYIASRL